MEIDNKCENCETRDKIKNTLTLEILRNKALHHTICGLVDLKEYKDKNGKDEHYEEIKPVIWAKAKLAVILLGEKLPEMKKSVDCACTRCDFKKTFSPIPKDPPICEGCGSTMMPADFIKKMRAEKTG